MLTINPRLFDKNTQEVISAIEDIHKEIFEIILKRARSLYNIITFDISDDDIIVKGFSSEPNSIILDELYYERLGLSFNPSAYKYYDYNNDVLKYLFYDENNNNQTTIYLPQGIYKIKNGPIEIVGVNPNIIYDGNYLIVNNNTFLTYKTNNIATLNIDFQEETIDKPLSILNPLLVFYKNIIPNIFNTISILNPQNNIKIIIRFLKNFLYYPTRNKIQDLFNSIIGKYKPDTNSYSIINISNNHYITQIVSYPDYDFLFYHNDTINSEIKAYLPSELVNNNFLPIILSPKVYLVSFNKNYLFLRADLNFILRGYTPFGDLENRIKYKHSKVDNVEQYLIFDFTQVFYTKFYPFINACLNTLISLQLLIPQNVKLGFIILPRT